ncbi:MAG TPA: membrane dipeptidase [Lachnospiraceae bacterium]|nr:membrane dipeptidase [Lachnospiraceae bacterium]
MNNGYDQRARELHKQYPVVDAHLDLPAELYYRKIAGEKDIIKNRYMKHWREGGFRFIVCSVFLENEILPEFGLTRALEQIEFFLDEIKESRDDLLLVLQKEDIAKVLTSKKIGMILYMEGLDCIGERTHLLDIFYKLGVRGAALTWSRRNQCASGCCKATRLQNIPGGITDFGLIIIKKMEALGMFLDVSHLNDDGFEDVLNNAQKPFMASHSNSRDIYYSYRNLTVTQMLALQSRGGVMGLNANKYIVGAYKEKDENVFLKMCQHIEYAVKVMGDSHVGFGFDLCDSYMAARPRLHFMEEQEDCLKNHEESILVTALLLERGMAEASVIKIIGGNFVKFFKKVL